MKGSFKRHSKGVFQARADGLRAALPGIAQRTAASAKQHAQQSLILNVYGTQPGQYVRTEALLRQVYAHGSAHGATLHLTLGDQADHASFVEFGTGPYHLSAQQLQSYVRAIPPGSPLLFGRSGVQYMLPGPYIAPALHHAKHRMVEDVRRTLRDLWR